jgi:Transposase DDE domain
MRDMGWVFVTCLKKNRYVNRGEILERLDIPDEGWQVHLRGFGWVTVFRFVAKNGRADCAATNMPGCSRARIERHFKARWPIEVFHRELKQTCSIKRCQAHTSRAQRDPILAVMALAGSAQATLPRGCCFLSAAVGNFRQPVSLTMQHIPATT